MDNLDDLIFISKPSNGAGILKINWFSILRFKLLLGCE